MNGVDVVMAVVISGSVCGLASWGWIVGTTVHSYVVQRRLRRARSIERRVLDGYRRAAAVHTSGERPALLRQHVESLTDQELIALQSIGSMLYRKASDARRAALLKAARRG